VRAFVAVWPPPEVAQGLAGIDRPARPGIRWTTEDQWHVTLRFLGEIDDSEAQGVKASLQQLASVRGMQPVTAVAGPSVAQLGSSILCVPVAGLDQLAAAVAAALIDSSGTGPVPEERPFRRVGDRPFRGHITLARAARGVRHPLTIPVPFSASWRVDDITLVASTLHPAGAQYRVVERYPLLGRR
jgi:RNA 2',3'-cyclic 3'-phosphodiesterase